MAKRRKRRKSKRGGGAASAVCRKKLGACMTTAVRAGKSMKAAGGTCMRTFNRCWQR